MENAGKLEEGLNSKVSPAVNSSYGVFEEDDVPTNGGQVKKAVERHQDENTIAFLGDGFLVDIKLKLRTKIINFACILNFQKIRFFPEKL